MAESLNIIIIHLKGYGLKRNIVDYILTSTVKINKSKATENIHKYKSAIQEDAGEQLIYNDLLSKKH